MESEKCRVVECFISQCEALDLSAEDTIILAAQTLAKAVIASGNRTAKIEIENVGIVQVDC